MSRLYYKPGSWLDGTPTLINGDGDGTVNRRSLEGCQHWQSLQKQKVFYEPLPKTDHLGILHSNLTLEYIISLVKADEPQLKEYVAEETQKQWLNKLWHKKESLWHNKVPYWPNLLRVNDV